MALKVTFTGNAGVLLENEAGKVYVDSFFHGYAPVGGAPLLKGAQAVKADLILVTHAHGDHLDQREVLAAVETSGAKLAGPAAVTNLFAKQLPADRLLTLESPERKKPPTESSLRMGNIAVTSFRTYHDRGHNSYLIEMGDARIFHDGDNERTQHFDLAKLGRIDVLLACPWQGSGLQEFVERVKPGKWALIHLTDEEIEQHRNGEFLPYMMTNPPKGVLALRGGESMVL